MSRIGITLHANAVWEDFGISTAPSPNQSGALQDAEALYVQAMQLEQTSFPNSKAVRLYRKAYEQGHPEAAYRLGSLAAHGYYSDSALTLFTFAAEHGSMQAMLALAQRSLNQGAVSNAKKWFEVALDHVSDYEYISVLSQYSCSMLRYWRRMNPAHVPPNELKETLGNLQEAANADDSAALFQLALCYRDGFGFRANTQRAKYYAQRAKSLGSAEAAQNLQTFWYLWG